MKKLILDYSKWRCGSEGDFRVGEGETKLLNDYGFMCCLGQFSTQINKQITEDDLFNVGEPQEMVLIVPDLSVDGEADYGFISTDLTDKAISVNDNDQTTPIEKISILRKLFKPYGYEIEVINQP